MAKPASSEETRPCKLYVTQQREYLVFQDACVGVRDRPSGRWYSVLPNRVVGSVPGAEREGSFACAMAPRVGERLCIQVRGRRVVSSVVLSIERARLPPRQGLS